MRADMRNNISLVLVSTLLLVGACRASGGGDDAGIQPDSMVGQNPDAPANSVTTVSAIRQNQPVTGAAISLRGVIVTARVSSTKSGKLWVQDAGGGMYSGIEVFCSFTSTSHPCTMTRAQIDAIAVGQTVDVDGSFDVFTPSMPAGAVPTLEISQPTITNSGGIVAPTAVDADLGLVAHDQQMSAATTPYIGAYVHVAAPVTVSNVAPTEFSAACPTTAPDPTGTQYFGVEMTSGSTILDVGLNFYSTLTYCIASCGYTCANPLNTQTFTSISGIVEADANSTTNDVYLKISPVEDTDLPL